LQNETFVLIRGNQEGYGKAGETDEPCSLFIHPIHPFSVATFLPSNKPQAEVLYCPCSHAEGVQYFRINRALSLSQRY